MPLIVEARHLIVRLRLEIDAGNAAMRHGIEERHAGACHEIVHERGDEHGLARAREPGHAKPDGRLDEVRGEVADIAESIDGAMGEGGNRHA